MTNTNAQRAKVFHGTLEKTSGGLTKKDLKKNEYGKIVSKRASSAARTNNNLGDFKKTKKGFQLSPAKGTKDYKDMLSKKSGNKSSNVNVVFIIFHLLSECKEFRSIFFVICS